jgi:outer membrane lipoprotein-sorting protein
VKKIMVLITALALTGISAEAGAEMTGQEIVEQANLASYYRGDDGKSDVKMVITDSLGRTREKEMTILRRDDEDGGEQKFYVYFERPSDEKGTTYLVWKKPGGDDDRWLYLPAMDLVRRIASSDKRSSFVGSDFAYEDISGRGTGEDDHTLLGEEEGHYKIKSVPRDPGSVEFDHFITWVDKKNFLPVRAELYDKNGKLYKKMEALEVTEIQGYPTVTRMRAENLNSGGSTVSSFSNVVYDLGLDDKIFTERSLRKAPRQYIK